MPPYPAGIDPIPINRYSGGPSTGGPHPYQQLPHIIIIINNIIIIFIVIAISISIVIIINIIIIISIVIVIALVSQFGPSLGGLSRVRLS